jgi:hypothetical protein
VIMLFLQTINLKFPNFFQLNGNWMYISLRFKVELGLA